MCVYVGYLWKKVDLLELELQLAVSLPIWVLGTKFGSSGRGP